MNATTNSMRAVCVCVCENETLTADFLFHNNRKLHEKQPSPLGSTSQRAVGAQRDSEPAVIGAKAGGRRHRAAAPTRFTIPRRTAKETRRMKREALYVSTLL